jgi:hypothetical protein
VMPKRAILPEQLDLLNNDLANGDL